MKLGVFTALLSQLPLDPIAAIRVLGEAVFHVHAKDTQIYSANLPKTGVLDTKPYTDERNRSWIFRTCGYGHDDSRWKEFISTLHLYGIAECFPLSTRIACSQQTRA
jgi:sugar phosphate isomerase/epimerase